MRADACRCARPELAVTALLVDRLEDLNVAVRAAAACALGRMGRLEARPALVALLGATPSAEIIDAVEPIADEECFVLLGRIARTIPAFANTAWQALESAEHPHATRVKSRLGASSATPSQP